MADERPLTTPHAPAVLVIAGLCAGIELALQLADLLPVFDGRLRQLAYMNGAFWPGLLDGWVPNYALQPGLMFVTYAFLHGGLLHMVFNVLILVHLGRETVARLGSGGFVLAFVVTSALGGGVYALLSTSDAPMLGASGAVFGLFGLSAWWDIQRRRARAEPLQPVWRMMGGLVVMNILLWFLVGGALAWQTHLGGFLAGLALGIVLTPTAAHRWRG